MPESTNPMRKKWFRNYVIVMTGAIVSLLILLFAWEPEGNTQETARAEGTRAAANTAAAGPGENSGEALESASREGVLSQSGTYFIRDTRTQGAGGFQNFFTCVPEYGEELNIQIKNNNSSGVIIVNVTRGPEDYGFVDIKAGQSLTRTFRMADGSGVSGDWKVYITTRDGHQTDFNVAAEQH